jgi:cytochrome c biogenesis protein CcdA
MTKMLEVIGGLTIIFALLVVYGGGVTSAFQETTVAILWCGGWLIMAAGAIARRMDQTFTVVAGKRPGDQE